MSQWKPLEQPEFVDDVTLIPAGARPPAEPDVSEAALAQTKITTNAQQEAADGLARLEAAVEWATIIHPAQRHRDMLTTVRQFVEEMNNL